MAQDFSGPNELTAALTAFVQGPARRAAE